MIERIEMQKIASYKDKAQINLKKINFIYGSNGSGKTTISRFLNNPKNYTDSSIIQDEENEILVYNNDFVDLNFNNNSIIKGIFTLGKDSNDIIDEIKKLDDERNVLLEQIKNKEHTLNNQRETLKNKRISFNDQCWNYKNEYNSSFRELFVGKVGNKELFSNYCLNIVPTTAKRKSMEELIKTYNALYVNKLVTISKINQHISIDLSDLPGIIALNESISNNKTTQISILIDSLMNSDWVKKGVDYLKTTKDICPFCQQKIGEDQLTMLNRLFDESYDLSIKHIENAKEQYNIRIISVIKTIQNIIDSYGGIFDVEELKSKKILLENTLNQNNSIFDNKLTNPSLKFMLIPLDEILVDLNELIATLENLIDENNRKVNDIKNEKQKLIEDVNNSLYDKLKNIIISFNKDINGLNKGISNIEGDIAKLKKEEKEKQKNIGKLRASMSGITNTLDKMNKLLDSFGFVDFSFVANDSNTYKVVRADGTDVGKTLSEGEQRFISFLYFYQLIQGTLEESGIKKDRIIVIDDPISSLDSNILFIVSTLVKNIIDDCLLQSNNIKQVLILTHNVYFFKEITFRPLKPKKNLSFADANTRFFIIQKNNGSTSVQEYLKNPISTTYDLLWDEIRDNSEKNKGTIFNTMRRILEYYFNIIGGLNYEKLINEFEGEEKQLCHSLLSCINDSSHYIPDDYNIIVTKELIEKYIKVFKLIFDKSGHSSHYNMMMKVDSDN